MPNAHCVLSSILVTATRSRADSVAVVGTLVLGGRSNLLNNIWKLSSDSAEGGGLVSLHKTKSFFAVINPFTYKIEFDCLWGGG